MNAYINPLSLPTTVISSCALTHSLTQSNPHWALETFETFLFPPPPWLDPTSGIAASDRDIGVLGSPKFAILYCNSHLLTVSISLLQNVSIMVILKISFSPNQAVCFLVHAISFVLFFRKTRIWLGTFETAEDAARAYDEAARLMCGTKARTNFSYNPNETMSHSSKLLSAALIAKLHKCNMASLQMAKTTNNKPVPKEEPQQQVHYMPAAPSATCIIETGDVSGFDWPEKIKEYSGVQQWVEQGSWVGGGDQVLESPHDHQQQHQHQQEFIERLEDDHIEQMIEELLDYGHIEICPGVST